MFSLFDKIENPSQNTETIRRRRYGVITIIEGQLDSIAFRPWPKLISGTEISLFGNKKHEQTSGDRCVLFYNQPIFHSNFLALKYVVSNLGTSYRSFRKSLSVLDQVAEIKRSDALLCEVFNQRISDRFLARMGWEQHLAGSKKRHFIKRFYGKYPSEQGPRLAPSARKLAAGVAVDEPPTPPQNPAPVLFPESTVSSPDSTHVS